MNKVVDNQEMLRLIREDRPKQIIHEVLGFKLNQYGFYDVRVRMQYDGMDLVDNLKIPTIKNVKIKIPYPTSEYLKLTEKQQFDWRWE